MSLQPLQTLARLGARREEAARVAVAAAELAVERAEGALRDAREAVAAFALERRARERDLFASVLGRGLALGELERLRLRCARLADQADELDARARHAADELDRSRAVLAEELTRWHALRRTADARGQAAQKAHTAHRRKLERHAEVEADDRPLPFIERVVPPS